MRRVFSANATRIVAAALMGVVVLHPALVRAATYYPPTDVMSGKEAKRVEFMRAVAYDRKDQLAFDHGYTGWYEELREEANHSYRGVSRTDTREIACWGDSMIEGMGGSEATVELGGKELDVSFMAVPQVLQRLTGLKAFNFGIPAATSEEIAVMQGGLAPQDTHEPLSIFDARIAYLGAHHTGNVLILEIGSNGGWDNRYKRLANQYRAMIEHAGCDDYLVIGDTDDPGTSIGDLRQEAFAQGAGPGETAWEAALNKAFGDHFINMRVYLIEHGLEVSGLEPSAEDLSMARHGCVSTQLRADWTHLNSYGYFAQAMGIYERGLELGYWGPAHMEEPALLPWRQASLRQVP